MWVELALISHPSESNKPTITENWYGGILIISLSCLVKRPQPTPEGKVRPQTTKSVHVEIFFCLCKLVKVVEK